MVLVKTAGGNLEDRFDGVSTDSFAAPYIAGLMNGNVNFESIPVSSSGITYYPTISKLGAMLSTTENKLPSFIILQNPVSYYVEFNSDLETVKGSIFSIFGQEIKKFETKTKIDVQELSSGIYFIQLEDKRVFKFVKV